MLVEIWQNGKRIARYTAADMLIVEHVGDQDKLMVTSADSLQTYDDVWDIRGDLEVTVEITNGDDRDVPDIYSGETLVTDGTTWVIFDPNSRVIEASSNFKIWLTSRMMTYALPSR